MIPITLPTPPGRYDDQDQRETRRAISQAFAQTGSEAAVSTADSKALSAASNTITSHSDYQTGAWTPADDSGAGLSLTTQDTTYIKIGKMVFAFFRIVFPATASGAGVLIGDLPFVVKNTTGQVHPVVLSYTTAGISMSGLTVNNVDRFELYKTDGSQVTNVDLSSKEIRGSAIYETA